MVIDGSKIEVAGSDGKVPVYDPNSRWTIWSYQELWFGKTGANKYVPKVNDYVVDYETNLLYIVVSLNSELVPTLRELKGTACRELTDIDNILRSKRRTSPDSYRIYLDTSVNPYKLTIDSRFTVGGSFNTYAQIFKGSKIDNSGTVISTIFDDHGELVSTKVRLELVNQEGKINHCEKCVPPCYTTTALSDDEILTVVIYNDEGGVSSIQEFYVYNTAVIRQTDTNKKYIKDITLESIYMSNSDPYTILCPLNVNVRGMNLFGVIHYSDGTTERMPVDGRKFKILNLTNYVATEIGYEHDVVLGYYLSPGEEAVGLGVLEPGAKNNPYVSTSDNRAFITKKYIMKIVQPDGSYTVKLYGYPVWVNMDQGYRLEWFLCNLDRTIWKKVTPYVKFNKNTKSYDSTLYGVSQTISISIDLKEAQLAEKQYIHTQMETVTLETNGTDKTKYRWSIGFELTQKEPYGIDNWANVKILETDKKQVDISLGESKFDIWLDRIWKRTKPLYDSFREAYAPTPDMFTLLVNNVQYTYKISQWNQILEISTNLNAADNIYVIFFKRMSDTDLYLGISALPVFIL